MNVDCTSNLPNFSIPSPFDDTKQGDDLALGYDTNCTEENINVFVLLYHQQGGMLP